MILSFRSRVLKRFWERDQTSKLPPDRIQRIAMILDRLEAATAPDDAVSVSANWRITFAWQDLDAVDVDFEDYH
jgi:proteic killer suppression protein